MNLDRLLSWDTIGDSVVRFVKDSRDLLYGGKGWLQSRSTGTPISVPYNEQLLCSLKYYSVTFGIVGL